MQKDRMRPIGFLGPQGSLRAYEASSVSLYAGRDSVARRAMICVPEGWSLAGGTSEPRTRDLENQTGDRCRYYDTLGGLCQTENPLRPVRDCES